MSPIDDIDSRTHYHFRIRLRVRHPTIDPEQITEALAIKPKWFWKAGQPRRTLNGKPLVGCYQNSYWSAQIAAGRWPLNLNDAIHGALKTLVRHRPFLHRLREEGGEVEFFIGWFFESQSGEVLTHQCLALAGDLQIDLSFDVYSPD